MPLQPDQWYLSIWSAEWDIYMNRCRSGCEWFWVDALPDVTSDSVSGDGTETEVCWVKLRCAGWNQGVLGETRYAGWNTGVLGETRVCWVKLRCAGWNPGMLGETEVCWVKPRCAWWNPGVLGETQVCWVKVHCVSHWVTAAATNCVQHMHEWCHWWNWDVFYAFHAEFCVRAEYWSGSRVCWPILVQGRWHDRVYSVLWLWYLHSSAAFAVVLLWWQQRLVLLLLVLLLCDWSYMPWSGLFLNGGSFQHIFRVQNWIEILCHFIKHYLFYVSVSGFCQFL